MAEYAVLASAAFVLGTLTVGQLISPADLEADYLAEYGSTHDFRGRNGASAGLLPFNPDRSSRRAPDLFSFGCFELSSCRGFKSSFWCQL